MSSVGALIVANLILPPCKFQAANDCESSRRFAKKKNSNSMRSESLTDNTNDSTSSETVENIARSSGNYAILQDALRERRCDDDMSFKYLGIMSYLLSVHSVLQLFANLMALQQLQEKKFDLLRETALAYLGQYMFYLETEFSSRYMSCLITLSDFALAMITVVISLSAILASGKTLLSIPLICIIVCFAFCGILILHLVSTIVSSSYAKYLLGTINGMQAMMLGYAMSSLYHGGRNSRRIWYPLVKLCM